MADSELAKWAPFQESNWQRQGGRFQSYRGRKQEEQAAQGGGQQPQGQPYAHPASQQPQYGQPAAQSGSQAFQPAYPDLWQGQQGQSEQPKKKRRKKHEEQYSQQPQQMQQPYEQPEPQYHQPEQHEPPQRQYPQEAFEPPTPKEIEELNDAPHGNLYLSKPPKPDDNHKKAMIVGIGALAALGVAVAAKGHIQRSAFKTTMRADAHAAASEVMKMGNSQKAARFTRKIEHSVFKSGDDELIKAFKDMENTGKLPPGRVAKSRLAHLKGSTKRDTMDNIAAEFHESKVEFSVIVSPENNIRYASRGGSDWGFIDSADKIGKEMDKRRNYFHKGVYSLYHNHPDESGFSKADVDTMGRMGFGEMYASTPSGKLHRMTMPKGMTRKSYEARMKTWNEQVMPEAGKAGADGIQHSIWPMVYSDKKIGSRTPYEAAGVAIRAGRKEYKATLERNTAGTLISPTENLKRARRQRKKWHADQRKNRMNEAVVNVTGPVPEGTSVPSRVSAGYNKTRRTLTRKY